MKSVQNLYIFSSNYALTGWVKCMLLLLYTFKLHAARMFVGDDEMMKLF